MMKKGGALEKRLDKSKRKRSVSISIRLPREDVEGLDEIELKTDLRYDWLIRMLVRRLLHFWKQEKKIEAPLYVCVITKEHARALGLIENDSPDSRKITWLHCN